MARPPVEPAPTLMGVLRRSAAWLAGKGVANARRECEWLFAHRLGCSRLELYTRFDMPLGAGVLDRLRDDLRRRGRREPLAYILGTQPFAGLELVVGPEVLVPRPETEELVALVLASLAGRPRPRVVDVGTGSGAIALALARARPDAAVTAVDCSAPALATARANAGRLGLEVAFLHGDLLDEQEGPWDLVVANLPYVAEEERARCDPETAFEPAAALFAPARGLGLIRRLVADLPRVLAAEGEAWLEFGLDQGEGVRIAGTAAGLTCRLYRDGTDRDRFARLERSR